MLILCGTATAHAGNPENGITPEDAARNAAFVKALFNGPPAPDKTSYACFVRYYDTAHLARHPRQKVRAMTFLVRSKHEPESEGLHYSFDLGVSLRAKRGSFASTGYCSHSEISAATNNEARLDCGIDCEGGSISLGLGKEGHTALIRFDQIKIWDAGGTDETLEAGVDDKIFQLDRVDFNQCRALVTDPDELAALRHK
jgi:hypothetical protein